MFLLLYMLSFYQIRKENEHSVSPNGFYGNKGLVNLLAIGNFERLKSKECHGLTGLWKLPKGFGKRLESLEGWQLAPLNAVKAECGGLTDLWRLPKAWGMVWRRLTAGKWHL